MSGERKLGEIIDYDGLIAVLRARLNELDISHATLERISGLPSGYTGKVLGSLRRKALGPVSLGLMLQALAVKLVAVEDTEAANRMGERWEKRMRPDYNASRQAPIGNALISRVLPILMERFTSAGGRARAQKLSAANRRRIARLGGLARWGKVRTRRAGHAQDSDGSA